MNRRGFLQLLSAGAIGTATLDVERLLWVPGQKTIFLPSTNPTLLDAHSPIAWIAKEAMDLFALATTQPVYHDADHALSPRLAPSMTYPFNIRLPLPDLPTWKEVKAVITNGDLKPGRLSHNIIQPSMYALADAFRQKQHQTFGRLSAESAINGGCDVAVATDPVKGVSVRARRWQDIYNGRTYLAFDVIGGA